jgi:phasin family protein
MKHFQPAAPAISDFIGAQFSLFTDLYIRLFDSAKQINELNTQAIETVLEESMDSFRVLLSANTPYEVISLSAAQAQPVTRNIRAYQQHLTSIAAGTQAELAKTAESHVSETTRAATAVADEVVRQVSEGTENMTQRRMDARERRTSQGGGAKRSHKVGRKHKEG